MKKVLLILFLVTNPCNVWADESDRRELSREGAIEIAKVVGTCAGVVVLCFAARRYLPVTKNYLDVKIEDLKNFMTKDVCNFLADKIENVSLQLSLRLRGAEGRLNQEIIKSREELLIKACETHSEIVKLRAQHADLNQKLTEFLDINREILDTNRKNLKRNRKILNTNRKILYVLR